MLLERQLAKAGYEVVACENGKQALEAIRRENACIVVADWMMPEMDGLELCKTVRMLGQMKAISYVYFILLTAQSDSRQIVAGLEAGSDDYLTKPYRVKELLARLRAGERIFSLQKELMQRQVELHRVNGEFAKLNLKLEELANTDMLTSLANRRCFFERFDETWELAGRKGQSLACIMFDIDKFKLINDTYGHAAGDAVLKKVSAVTRASLRRYDIVGRIGGEEFCIICPQTSIDDAALVAERLRADIAQTEFRYEQEIIPVAVSIGVAGRNDEHAGPDALAKVVDGLLYKAKENGRNQVWVLRPNGESFRFTETALVDN